MSNSSYGSLNASRLEPRVLEAVEKLGAIAKARKQTMVQLSLAWVLRRKDDQIAVEL